MTRGSCMSRRARTAGFLKGKQIQRKQRIAPRRSKRLRRKESNLPQQSEAIWFGIMNDR